MKVAIFTSVFCLFSGLVSSVAIPAEAPTIEARTIATISPSLSVPIYEDSPDYAGGNQSYAIVSRYNGAHDISTLIAYYFPVGYPGKQCSFFFTAAQGLDGSEKVQLFTVGGQDITSEDTFNSRPFRNNQLGIFNADIGTFDGSIPTFDFPSSPTTLGFEVVPQGDNDYVWWYINAGGLVININ